MNYANAVRKLNNWDVPMGETHYYQWLAAHAFRYIGPGTAALGYLEYMFGFVMGVDRIDGNSSDGLRTIHAHYWNKRLGPSSIHKDATT